METLLQNPAIQGGIAPFLVAVLTCLALLKIPRWIALAIPAAFLTVVLLTTGIEFTPLTSTRKILIIILIATVMGVLAQLSGIKARSRFVYAFIAGAAASIWVAWPVLARESDNSVMAGMVLSITIYSGFITSWLASTLAQRSILASAPAGISLAFTLGISAIIAASALLGQMGLGVGVAIIAILAVTLLIIKPGTKKATRTGELFGLIVGSTLSVLAIAAVLYAKLPWYALLPTFFIPAIAMIELNKRYPAWKQAGIVLVLSALPGLLTIYLAWDSAGDVYF